MLYHIWLSELSGLSCQKKLELIRLFGSARSVYDASQAELAEKSGLRGKALAVMSDKKLEKAKKTQDDCRIKSIDIITISDKRYPQRLREIPEPPIVLYVRGKLPNIDDYPTFAIVGSRTPEMQSGEFVQKIAEELCANGFLIVSGLARGIDGIAQKKTIRCGYPTVGVLGTAIDNIYPAEHMRLGLACAKVGALISEYPPGKKTFASSFVSRNRIISGLSLGTLVVQAGSRSGSLSTANHAMNQGREVFVSPGLPGSPLWEGSNDLLKKGARITTCSDDIISYYKSRISKLKKIERVMDPIVRKTEPQKVTAPEGLSREEETLYMLCDGKRNIDDIIAASGMQAHDAAACLTYMELSGLITQRPGQIFVRN